jgi:hypothetical protein
MAVGNLSYWDYVKAAFHLKAPMGMLGNLPINKMLLGGFLFLGSANLLANGNPGIFLLGIAYEIAYLMFLPSNVRFQKLVRGTLLNQDRQSWLIKQNEIFVNLDRSSQNRYRQIYQLCIDILRAPGANLEGFSIEDFKSSDVNQLLGIFLRLLDSRRRIVEIMSPALQTNLEKEIKTTKNQLDKEDPNGAVFRSLQSTLEIQNRRYENISKATENIRYIDAELDRIEKQITLLKEEVAMSSDPQYMSTRLDTVMDSLHGTTKWMSEHAEIFGGSDLPDMPRTIIESEHS